MARHRESRSPSAAENHRNPHRPRKDDDRHGGNRFRDERDRREDGRGYRRRSRSRSPLVSKTCYYTRGVIPHSNYLPVKSGRYRDRERDRPVDRERDRDFYSGRRDRPVDRRDEDYQRRRDDRGGRRSSRSSRSRDRQPDRPRSPDRRRDRSRDQDRDRDRRRRDDSRDRVRGRQDGTDSRPRSVRQDSRDRRTPIGNSGKTGAETPKSEPAAEKSAADKQAERRAKMEAWKKKREVDAQKLKDVNPAQTRNLLAEMDKKAAARSRTATPDASLTASPAGDHSGSASPAVHYAGKFDPKAIAKRSSAAKSSQKDVLGSPLDAQTEKLLAAHKQAQAGQYFPPQNENFPSHTIAASALNAKHVKASAFGFGKSVNPTEKPVSKRKLDLSEEDDTKRKLTKLPTLLADADDTPYADQDDDNDSDGIDGNFAETEEEAAAAARALQEKRMKENEEKQNADEEMKETVASEPAQVVDEQDSASAEPAQPAEQMELEEEDDVDPLDAFMAELDYKPIKTAQKPIGQAAKQQEPEALYSDDDYGVEAEDDADAKKLLAIANKRKKKDIPTTDWSKTEMIAIRKNFWVEPSELNNLSEADITDLRLELDGIKVSGKDVPKPVQKWGHCGLSRATLDIIADMGFEKPTPIQMQAIPTIMSGRDVIGVAKTGSGKTMAFLLPMFRHIKDQPPLKDMDGPIGLIMAPTRELAVQIHKDCKPFLKIMGLRAVCGYGGAPIKDQIAELKRGAEIVVCTPGRVIDLLAANQGRVTNLRRVSYVVLDEADRMFDMGFEPQVMKIFANMRPDKQTILFSATMPRIIDSLTKKVLKTPVEITVGGRSVVAKEIEQIVEVREETTKFLRTLELLGELYENDEDARSLLFVERQEKADDLLKELMNKGYPCMSIHGGKDQIDRDSTISDFKKGVIPILIATSVAARGLDVKQLKLVINYDAPNHMEDYVHRAGRTGRAGNKGVAVTFVTPTQENCAPGIAKALEQSEEPVAVPEQLNAMRKAHRDKVKSGSAKDSSGFGGKGLDRLDAEREAARNRERKVHNAEGEEEEEKDEEKEKKDDEKHERALSAIRQAASSIQSRQEVDITFKISEIKPGREGDPAGGAGGQSSKGGNNALDKVSSAVNAINSRLGKAGQLRAGQPIDNKGPDAGAFHATLEINDFPQKARWAVTNRTNVFKVLEATGVSITTKGSYYAPGKEPPAGAEPKLYVLIEGDTELSVSSALTELTRLLREATIADAEGQSRAPASSRYTIT